MSFRLAFSLHLIHPYYADGVCPDFLIEPTSDTERRLRNHRCVLKSGPNWVRAYLDSDLIPLEPGEIFVFHLRMQNPEFALVTDVRQTSPLYTNEGLSSKGAAVGQPLILKNDIPVRHREVLVVNEPVPSDVFQLRVRPSSPAGFKVDGISSTVTKYTEAANTVTVDTQSAKPGDEFTVEYPIQPPLYRIHPPADSDVSYRVEPPLFPDIFADVKISVNDPWQDLKHQECGLGEFQVKFKCKEAKWVYYLVSDLNEEKFNEYSVVDRDKNPIRFTPTDLNSSSDPNDAIAKSLAEQYGTLKRIRFESVDAVKCQQLPRKKIQLLVRKVDDPASIDNLLAAPLPNPSLHNVSTMATTSGDQEDSLFQVFRYLTNSSSPTGA